MASCNSSTAAGPLLHFIPVVGPEDAAARSARRLARSHAVKHGLESQRREQQRRGDNFRVLTAASAKPKKKPKGRPAVTPPHSLCAGALDPFQTLAVDSSRLQTLLGDYRARQAPEPVFSVAEGLAFQHFHTVFRTGLVDAALVNAVMLSLVFASTGGSIDRECLQYQGQAIRSIREKMGSRDEAVSESTIGAILLLAGVEARLGTTLHVQLHMRAVQQLLGICQKDGVNLTDGIKRAIFWQDLHCFILAGSSRIADHTTFSELQWTRDQLPSHYYSLPYGFQMFASLLPSDFVDVIKDVSALQHTREESNFGQNDAMFMAHINNRIASIQSRLMALPTGSPLVECCRLAAYICSAMLCCTVWCGLVIPTHFSTQLLCELQKSGDDPIWDDHREVVLWLLYVGGSFAPRGPGRFKYVELLRSENEHVAWSDVNRVLRRFLWSDKAFMLPAKMFWAESWEDRDGS